MNLLIPSSKISRQSFPCPGCDVSTPVEVITEINTDEDFCNYYSHHLNRALCASCGALVEAPVRLTVKLGWWEGMPVIECVPLVMLRDPEVLDDLIHNTRPDTRMVYSHDELLRSLEACIRLELRRHNYSPEEIDAAIARFG